MKQTIKLPDKSIVVSNDTIKDNEDYYSNDYGIINSSVLKPTLDDKKIIKVLHN